ncbi:uncharacterized protein (TIGR02246 family) [Motilibacter peucedani]|uniref:Uncharacterized protein (TIGR02246 family) n=1 Tax=Motilibacter peucedani TaxID=598650 RepID=A0A420XQT2_9ACTN|nr:SgcJ/EcaC family oxidoreductase [Motilibacter peucedani]RKS75576.1 uncharacterized protein (TIGR02246 family) [Motilibacter peucedani]
MGTPTDPADLNDQWCRAFNEGDLARLVQMYEPDAVLVPAPGAEPLRGHTAIEAALDAFLALGGSLRFSPRHWLVHGDIALGSITFELDGAHDSDGAPLALHGTTAEVVRRQPDGSWKYVVDHPFAG